MNRSLLIASMLWSSCLLSQDIKLGVAFRELPKGKEAALAPCPSTPNCITSHRHANQKQSQTFDQLRGTRKEESKMKIKLFALKEKGELISETDNYLRFKFRAQFIGLSDDVEFFFPSETSIHFRSASSFNLFTDLGTNLRRIKRIEEALQL